MKTVYTWLVAGMLATATATPVFNLAARPASQQWTQVEMTDALAYRVLAEALGAMEQQLQRSMSTDILFAAYKAGEVSIDYLGTDGIEHIFQVTHADGGGILVSVIEDF